MSRKLSWIGKIVLCAAVAVIAIDQAQAQTETVRFCDVPTTLPRGTPLPNYSPVLCFEYGNLRREMYSLKAYLLETTSGNFFCASGQWCGDVSNPPAVFPIDNRDGTKSAGRLVVERRMDVFDYPGFLWVADLHNQAGQKIAFTRQDATSTTNRAPVLKTIGSKCVPVGQPLEFIVSASDPDGDAVTLSAQNLPPGATFDPATGRFRWSAPTAGAHSDILFKATQGGVVPLSDAEIITIQVGQRQFFSLSSDAYVTGEAGPAVITVIRTGSSIGAATVKYSAANVTAMAGTDYRATEDVLPFADGETIKAFAVPIVNDSVVEPNETFRVSLSEPTGCAVLEAPSTAIVTVVDDDTPSLSGKWEPVMTWPTVPIHAHLLPTGKVIFWDRHDHTKGWDGDPRLWDPATATFSAVPLPGYDAFCGGHSLMADGRLLVTGGHVPMPPALVDSGAGENKASIYDPVKNAWTRLPDMNAGRWYPSNLTLANGETLVLAGTTINVQTVNRLPQVWQPASGAWRDLTSAQQGDFPTWANFYPFLYLAPNGKVFYAGPQQITRYLDTSGTGAWAEVGKSSLSYRDYGSSVMYADGKVLIVGGNPYEPDVYSAPTILPSATAEVIDLNSANPEWRAVPAMSVGRRQHNATLLPDGKVLITGGSSLPGFDRLAGAVFYSELWDPATETWGPMAGYTRYRGYHSTALLLPDGRVLIGGGGHPNPEGGTQQNNIEIYSPPYLFKGARPTVACAPTQVTYGQTFLVQTPDAASISNVNWIRLSSVTHSFNQNQRINRLSFSREPGGLRVTAPASANLCPPGHYLLFILNSAGAPSVARIVQITAGAAASPVSNVSAASFTGTELASESIVSAFGTNMATQTEAANTFPLPTTLSGTTVSVRDSSGTERFSPLFFIAPCQVNYQIPSGTINGAATITVTGGNGATSSGMARIASVAPGLFAANANGQGVAAAVALRVSADGTRRFEPVARFDAAANRFVSAPIDLGPESDQVFLILFGTGFRFVSSLSAAVATIGGANAEVLFAAEAPGFAGLDQANVRLPRGLIGRGEVDVKLVVSGKPANTVSITIK